MPILSSSGCLVVLSVHSRMLLLNLYSSTIVFQDSLKFIVVHMDCGHYSGADLHVFLPLSGSYSKSIEGRKWPAHLCKSIVTQYFILLIKFGLWTSVLHSMWLSVYIIASSGFTICFQFYGVQHTRGHTNVMFLQTKTQCLCFQAVVAWLYYQYI